jgi:hypothetical protein
MHQVGPKDSGSQNFSFLALKPEPLGEVQILRTATATVTAMARDRQNFFIAQIMLFVLKKYFKLKISHPNVSSKKVIALTKL